MDKNAMNVSATERNKHGMLPYKKEYMVIMIMSVMSMIQIKTIILIQTFKKMEIQFPVGVILQLKKILHKHIRNKKNTPTSHKKHYREILMHLIMHR